MGLQDVLGRAIARRRRELGLSQEVVARRVGTNPKWLSQIETGRRAPSLDMLESICGALHSTLPELLHPDALEPIDMAGGTADPQLLLELQRHARHLSRTRLGILIAVASALHWEQEPDDNKRMQTSLDEAPPSERRRD